MGFQVFGNLVLGLGFRGAVGFASHSAGPSRKVYSQAAGPGWKFVV